MTKTKSLITLTPGDLATAAATTGFSANLPVTYMYAETFVLSTFYFYRNLLLNSMWTTKVKAGTNIVKLITAAI